MWMKCQTKNPQATSNSVRVLSPPLDRPALRAPITLPAYAQGEHRFISSTKKSPSKSPDSRPGSICAEAQCPLPHRPWVAKVLSDMQVIVAMANIIIIIITTIAVMNTPQPALAPAGLVRHAGDHQACVQHLLHHFNPHQAPPDDHQNQGQVEPPPPPPAGQAHREEALLVKVKRGNFREGQKCNHTFLRRLGVFTFVAIVTSNITFFITMSRLPIPT